MEGKFPSLDTRMDRIKMLMPCGSARSMTIIELERAFTLPDNYTYLGIDNKGCSIAISKTQRARMVGNGWVVKVIEQFFRNIEC